MRILIAFACATDPVPAPAPPLPAAPVDDGWTGVTDREWAEFTRPPPPPARPSCPAPCDLGGMAPGNAGACGDHPVVVLHHSQLTLIDRVEPAWPAHSAGLGDQRCLVTVRISDRGVPERISAEGCAAPLAAAAEDAVRQWRWKPPLDHCPKPAGSAQTKVVLTTG